MNRITQTAGAGQGDISEPQILKAYYAKFGSGYYGPDIFERYPETKTMPAYLAKHFAAARCVLDLGFGTGLWFWASFLRALERLDGIDTEPEALAEADKLFEAEELPEGFRLAHASIGQDYRLSDLQQLQTKRGRFFFLDYRRPWPAALASRRYDLVTEHGGGLGMMASDEEFIGVVRQVARVLRPSGQFFFANFTMKPMAIEKRAGKVPAPAFCLREDLFVTAVEKAGLKMADLHAVDQPGGMAGIDAFFYGYAEK